MEQVQFDWQGMETAAINYMVASVKHVHQEHPREHIYGAMFHCFYGDGDVIDWPCLAIGTEECLASIVIDYQNDGFTQAVEELTGDLRWSPADQKYNDEPNEECEQWANKCHEFAAINRTFNAWEEVYEQFLHVFPKAAKKARLQLIREGVVDKNFIAIASDEAGDLISLSLTKKQILQYFPAYSLVEQERKYLKSLPLETRIAELIAQIFGRKKTGLLSDEYEVLLKQLGKLALPALLHEVKNSDKAWNACKLIAEINESNEDVIAALISLVDDQTADGSNRCWAASALARLGYMNLLAERISQLPVEILVRGITAPYLSFRNHGSHLSLDYTPLEFVLSHHPDLVEDIAKEMAPGRGFCTITVDEVPAARTGLASYWPCIQFHAQYVLKEFEDNH
ncbi:DUF4303 domain-containing protein [Escherichia albertii]|uniref:DUF4303 domain-containing protein n=1 Tax=Escherichia albertii TaxID=208962 RepID=UPI00198E94C7|nr:DUF4303 domain-containing protein [Escherichia albertii]MCZ8677108.1 DUF4303 domain-containing protein [Escherichia albertii]WDB44483.1 DUF4303 domain-containing protein [Escherichia albertii]